jgi:hypothetical protein
VNYACSPNEKRETRNEKRLKVSREGRFGAFAARHLILLGRQLAAPFLIRFHNFRLRNFFRHSFHQMARLLSALSTNDSKSKGQTCRPISSDNASTVLGPVRFSL